MKTINKLLAIGLFTSLLACGGSPEKNIVNHWVAVAVEEEEDTGWGKKERPEFEFKKDGSVNIYNDGKIILNTTYALATDGKSLVINEPSGSDNLSLEIVTLGSKHLELVMQEGRWGRKDTVAYKPKK